MNGLRLRRQIPQMALAETGADPMDSIDGSPQCAIRVSLGGYSVFVSAVCLLVKLVREQHTSEHYFKLDNYDLL